MIVIVFWAIENNLVYLRAILVYDCISILGLFLRSFLFGSMIMIVSWAVGK